MDLYIFQSFVELKPFFTKVIIPLIKTLFFQRLILEQGFRNFKIEYLSYSFLRHPNCFEVGSQSP